MNFEKIFPGDATFDKKSRVGKAKKIVAVILDYFNGEKNLKVLDYGCSVGFMTNYFGKFFKIVHGVDIDKNALKIANKKNKSKNVKFSELKQKSLNFPDNYFDIVVLNQVYEHAENPKFLLKEIYRVLKPNGICYFGARNKYFVLDGHYPIPFLAFMPKIVSDFLIRIFFGKNGYDIKLCSFNELKKMVSDFQVIDYTGQVISAPDKFNLNKNYSYFRFLIKPFYFFIPNYIWILVKRP